MIKNKKGIMKLREWAGT